MFIVQLHLQLE